MFLQCIFLFLNYLKIIKIIFICYMIYFNFYFLFAIKLKPVFP